MRVPRLATCLSLAIVLLAACTAAAQLPVLPAQAPVLPARNGSLDLLDDLVRPLVLAVVFTAVGLLLFFACIFLIVRLAPFSVRREIEEDQNVAVGIIVGSMILGIAIILAAALLG